MLIFRSSLANMMVLIDINIILYKIRSCFNILLDVCYKLLVSNH